MLNKKKTTNGRDYFAEKKKKTFLKKSVSPLKDHYRSTVLQYWESRDGNKKIPCAAENLINLRLKHELSQLYRNKFTILYANVTLNAEGIAAGA